MFKKLLSCMGVLSLVLPSVTNVGSITAQESGVTDGEYTVVSKGHSEGLELLVTFEQGAIANVEVVSHNETQGISDAAIKEIPQKIVEHNSTNVEIVSGATETSNGIREGVSQAIMDAGGSVSDFFAEVESETQVEVETIEYHTDIVVAGGGIAGLSAAVEAYHNGAEVMLLEKQPFVGGSTMLSGGKILAAESSIQQAFGEDSTWEELADYFYEVSEEQGDREFIDYIAQHSAESIEWLLEHGVEISEELEQLHSSIEPYWGHFSANGSGSGLTEPLYQYLIDEGVEVLLSTPVNKLLQDDTGKVVGVEATDAKGNTIIVHAESVVLATGGFTMNEEMMAERHPYLEVFKANASPGNTGDGILMAEEIGAQTVFHDSGIDLAVNAPTYYGYGEEAKGLFVTQTGERFIDESRFHFERSREMWELGETVAYVITTEVNDRVLQAVEIGTAYAADSIEELGDLIEADRENQGVGMATDVLVETVDRYNELAVAGEDADFGKDAQYMVPVEGDTYYAIRMTTSNSGTIGGLVVTLDGEVLDTEDEAIEGLYAVGELASGQYMYIAYPGSGTAIISYLTLGRHVGEHAATQLAE